MYNDIEYKKHHAHAIQLRRFIFNKSKSKKIVDILGCDNEFIRKYFEFQFDASMNWDNYGTKWEIDHIVPCNMFEDKHDPLLWHFINIQPIAKHTNKRKGNSDGKFILIEKIKSPLLIKYKNIIEKLIQVIEKYESNITYKIDWQLFDK